MTSSYTTNKRLEKPANGDYIDTWNIPVNDDMDAIDKAFGGVTYLNATGVAGTVVLTFEQYRSLTLIISGTLTADVEYAIPGGVGGHWIVKNQTTGAFNVAIISSGAGSVLVEQGFNSTIFSDGSSISFTDTRPITPDENSVGTAQIQNEAVTLGKLAPAAFGSVEEFRSGGNAEILTLATPWSAANYITLVDAATLTIDFSAGFNFFVTIGGNRVLANPTNAKPGQTGFIVVAEDSTGGYTVSYGSVWKFPTGAQPVFDTGASRVNVICYTVVTPTFIVANVLPGVR